MDEHAEVEIGSRVWRNPGFQAVLLVLVLSSVRLASQGGSPDPKGVLLPPERLIDWGGAGVYANGVKGIPSYPVAVNAKAAPFNARGDGITDDTAAIRSAIAACRVGRAVLIPEGTYRISATLHIDKGIVVRGEGPDKTKIIQYASVDTFEIDGDRSSAVTDIKSGSSKDSDTIVVSSSSQFKVGDVVSIDQLNDPALVTQIGVGTCHWCGRYGVNGARAMGELKVIKKIKGKTITLNRPLYYNYKAEFLPQLVRKSGHPLVNAGIENLSIEAAVGDDSGRGIYMHHCVHCWVRGVESFNTHKKHIVLSTAAYGNEVRDCYIHGTQSFESDRGYGVNLELGPCDNLIENNIFYHLHYAIALESSGAGNVVAYNYVERMEHYDKTWFIQAMGTHGAHTYMNLWEGNVARMIQFDNYWGSGSHQMVLRNHFTRENEDFPADDNIVAAIVDANNHYDTFVGNILGTEGCEGEVEQIPYKSTRLNPVLWKIGYKCCSSLGYPSDAETAKTLIRHGNYDYITHSVTWDPNIADRSIPESLYLTSKPEWFGVLTWPPFAPERSDFDPGNLNKIPAQVRFENGPKIGLPYVLSRGY